MKYDVRGVFVLGTENLTSMEVPNDTTTTTVPGHSGGEVAGETLSTRMFSYDDVSPLSVMTITAQDVDPLTRLPVALTALFLYVTEEPFDVVRIAPLTRLQQLDIAVVTNASDDSTESTNDNSVDLSMLNSVTKLNTNITFVYPLPTSLQWCEIAPENDFDFSALTNLTVLVLWLRSEAHVDFPTSWAPWSSWKANSARATSRMLRRLVFVVKATFPSTLRRSEPPENDHTNQRDV